MKRTLSFSMKSATGAEAAPSREEIEACRLQLRPEWPPE